MHTFEVLKGILQLSLAHLYLDISIVKHYNQFNLYSHKFNIAQIYLDVVTYC